MARGKLRIFLGAAPGVGKTYAMLAEAHRRVERGTDVVVAFVEHHNRERTRRLLDGLEVLPRRTIAHRGAVFTEMDTDAVLARRPGCALVDELAHTNVPGSRHAKRWQDVEELLDAGIDVVSTVNVQHLESLGDAVAAITGVPQRETVPDEVVRRADEIELVDMSPPALRRRMAHGNVYAADKVDAALSNYFRPGNLTALRELALLWVADRTDEHLQRYRAEHGIATTWQARERIVVGLTGGPEGGTLIRRAARIAAKGSGSEILAVHVARGDGLGGASPRELAVQRKLVEDLGGTYHAVVGDSVPAALLEFARGVNATQVVLGTSRRRAWQYVFGPGVGATVARESGDIDVHIVTHEQAGGGLGLPRPGTGVSRGRRAAGYVFALVAPPLLTAVLRAVRQGPLTPTETLLFLTLTVAAALLGGLWPALATAVVATLLLDFYFTEPLHTLTVGHAGNVLSLAIFVLVAASVASVVDLAARRTQQAARSRAEAEALGLLAGDVLRGVRGLPPLLERVRETFGESSAALFEREDPRQRWRCVAHSGERPPDRPEDADVDMPVSETLALALSGRVLSAEDQRLLGAFAAQAAVVLERQRLAEEAAHSRRLAEGNRIRTALLAAVSHDLRTPLAGIKAAVSSLRAEDVAFSPEDEEELIATIDAGANRLEHLIGNLLDMSRLQTGGLAPLLRETALDEVVPVAAGALPPERVALQVGEDLPLVLADPGLLERAVGNVLENAARYHPAGSPVLVTASALRPAGGPSRVELRVVDRGPGVPEPERERVFAPFQRVGDAPRGSGVGLGLAVARGFTEAMGGSLTAEDTPGGGLTMVFTLPAAERSGVAAAGEHGAGTELREGTG
ncbi:sensor histidine kinase [Allostreptomyces psammosilenae]|uniref:histidine kinase n=1 Tax=Allostreptomyces psammosilenae TaxID=1892865 RepID=A0A852ZWX3_9ACTN|nr:sensor histidine kinase KdpD [Allostreptomyces psammosilenae]NYI03151.1 two-component system sensor histidine kinase KdpD [Allostreptomyces psammosilenae]